MLCTAAGNTKRCRCYENQYMAPRLTTQLLCDPAIPLLGLSPEEQRAGPGRGICMPEPIVAVLPRANTWKQSKRSRMEEQRSKMWDTQPIGFHVVLDMEGNSDTRYNVDKPCSTSCEAK